jgi:hypothetical protein
MGVKTTQAAFIGKGDGTRNKGAVTAPRPASKPKPNGELQQRAAIMLELRDLIATDISTPENAPQAGVIFARMMFLDFIGCAAGLNRPDGLLDATKRASVYYDGGDRAGSDTYFWALRVFSELHNCRQTIEDHIDATNLILDAISSAKGNVNDKVIDGANYLILETVNYIKAYNMILDAEATLTKTTELTLAKKQVKDIIDACKKCNKAIGADRIDTTKLNNHTTHQAIKTIESGVDGCIATLLSTLITAAIEIEQGAGNDNE